jgi:hypothetical protein
MLAIILLHRNKLEESYDNRTQNGLQQSHR